MERRSIIAVVAGSAGVLVATTLAGVAVVNAANSGTVAEPTSVVAAQPPTPGTVAQPDPFLESIESMPLPEIVIPEGLSGATQESPSATEAVITPRQARSAAKNATAGKILSTERVQHAGYDAYAVQIERADGSVVTGYVEASTGVVYDWVMNRAAPVQQPGYEDDDEGYENDDNDDHDEDDHDEDEHGDEEHDDDDD